MKNKSFLKIASKSNFMLLTNQLKKQLSLIVIITLSAFLLSSVPVIESNNRPDKTKRKFISEAVEEKISQNLNKINDKKLGEIYENCFPNTLDTTVFHDSKSSDTFIITGDIEAMWLRDSSFQVLPYVSLLKKDENLKKMFYDLIQRQSKSILIDPYANAFNKNEFNSPWQEDETYKLVDGKRERAMNQKIWERKYELDSLISPLFLAVNYMQETKDFSVLNKDGVFLTAVQKIIEVVKKESRGTDQEDSEGGPEYFFQRKDWEPFDSLHHGRGHPVNSCGLVKSAFRNSDDSSLFSYSVPENAFMVATFRKLVSVMQNYLGDLKTNLSNNNLNNKEPSKEQNSKHKHIRSDLFIEDESYLKISDMAKELSIIAEKVEKSIYKFGVFKDPETEEKYFGYEVDCFGNHYFIDDPGYPSLMALPFLGFIDSSDKIYQNTRRRILSNKNPYFIKGKLGESLGSAHTTRRNFWPLFTIMRGLTSTDEKEIKQCIQQLQKTAESTGFMHESVNIDNAEDYTRSWFAWANSFFGLLINHVIEKYPNLLA